MGAVPRSTETTEAAAQATSAPAIEARALRKSYGSTLAVESLNLRVEAGTVLGFLGPNGAGKTSAIRMLSTVLPPDSGTFTVAGVPHSRPVEIRRRIGVLPESAGYPQGETAEEWLTYHARLFGASRKDARTAAGRLLADVGLYERRRSRIANLSRGMRQRLGIARALVNNPQVVFLDEPTLGLDPMGQRQILDLVARIVHTQQVTVVLSTHVLAEVEEACDRVVILNRGRVVAEGTVAEIVRRVAAPRGGMVQVPPQLRERAVEVLTAAKFTAVTGGNARRGEVTLTLPGDELPEQVAAAALGRLLEAGVPVLGFSLEGGRLSDAFLAVTKGADDA
ncbi:MAG: ABC transporter ATP-binding protein [Nocardioidaceae bacterium]